MKEYLNIQIYSLNQFSLMQVNSDLERGQQQSFVSNDDIDIQLKSDSFAFDYFSTTSYTYLNQYQSQQNKTYVIFVAIYQNTNKTSQLYITLDIVKCSNPILKDMNCFDFSKLPDSVITKGNKNRVVSAINIFAYRCQDTDFHKTLILENCGSEQEINQFINSQQNLLNVKIQTSQFNITSQQTEQSYGNQVFSSTTNTLTIEVFKIQKQETTIKQGLLIQSENIFSSLISQVLKMETNNRQQIIQDTGLQFFNQIIIDVDENVTYLNIQYPIFTEVLALCNSTFAALLLLGTFCRKMARDLIKKDVFLVLLQNFFSSTYLDLIDESVFQNSKQEFQIPQNQKTKQDQDQEEQNEIKNRILAPYFSPKSNQKVFNQFLNTDFQKTNQDNTKKDNQTTFKKLITQEQQFLSEETEIKRQNTDFTENQKSQNLENSNQIPNIFQLQTSQQTEQIQLKDPKNSLIKGLSIIPRQQLRLKRLDQQNKTFFQKNKNSQIQHKEVSFQKQKGIALEQNIVKFILQTKQF
ncbi:hypothetical protein ABPG72_022272 [Tetrahymena utriculariae]